MKYLKTITWTLALMLALSLSAFAQSGDPKNTPKPPEKKNPPTIPVRPKPTPKEDKPKPKPPEEQSSIVVWVREE